MQKFFFLFVPFMLFVSIESSLFYTDITIDRSAPFEIVMEEENCEFQDQDQNDYEKEVFLFHNFSYKSFDFKDQDPHSQQLLYAALTPDTFYKPPIYL